MWTTRLWKQGPLASVLFKCSSLNAALQDQMVRSLEQGSSRRPRSLEQLEHWLQWWLCRVKEHQGKLGGAFMPPVYLNAVKNCSIGKGPALRYRSRLESSCEIHFSSTKLKRYSCMSLSLSLSLYIYIHICMYIHTCIYMYVWIIERPDPAPINIKGKVPVISMGTRSSPPLVF